MRSGWLCTLLTAALASSALSCAGKAKVEAKAAVSTPSDEDGDGIPDDGTDKCLKEKEDGLPPDSKDGCLSTDADGDGIADDGSDHCRDEKEDGLPPEPKDGCKTKDPDNDGVLGKADKCPEEAETNNDYQDEDGCPDKAPRVRVTKSEVKITEKIMFAFGKATIEKESDDLLDEIAYVVNDSPQIEFIEVAGHADKIGTDATNVQLTRARANAVQSALATRKVDRRRMRAAGYGRYCPLDAGDSDAAREKNRRVEFKIMRVDGVDTGVQLGCDESKKHGIHSAGVPAGAPKRAQLEKIREANPPEKPKPSKDPPPKATPPEKKPETKPATKPKPEAKPAAKPEAKPAAKAEAKPVPKPTAAKPAATAAATAQPLAPMPKK